MASSSNFIAGLYNTLSSIRNNIKKKFSVFYSKRLIDLEVVPTKTFSFDFTLDNLSISTKRKSISKLKSLIDKYLSKINPVIDLTNKSFIQLENNSSFIKLNILEIECGEVLPELNNKILEIEGKKYLGEGFNLTLKSLKTNPLAMKVFLNAHPDYILISRYVGYLNYLSRKYNIPLYSTLKNSAGFTDAEDTGILRIMLSIDIQFESWECTRNEYLDRYIRVQSGSEDDALFSLKTAWRCQPLSDNNEPYRYHAANFFLHLDKCLKVLNTLSRKVDYGYSAFSFRTV